MNDINKITKICSKCGSDTNISEFYRDKTKKDGYHTICKICSKVNGKIWKNNNIEKFKKFQADYRKYCKDNCPDKLIKSRKKWSLKNKDKIKDIAKKNVVKIREYKRKYKKKMRENNPSFKIGANLSKRIWDALRSQNLNKLSKTKDLLGCSIENFKNYLESLFKSGMTWENYGKGKGKWEIDHIRPCASFDLTDAEQQKQCFHYTNLQPMWGHINCAKHSYYDGKKYTYNKNID